MNIGIQFFPVVGPLDRSPCDYWRDALELAELAEAVGFQSIRTVEHYFHAYGGYSPNPLLFLSAVAMRATKARLITGALLPAFSHPLKLASEIGMLDAISGGRLEVGFARAFLPHEFRHFGVSLDESRDRFEEGVEQIRRLLEEECVSSDGRFHSFKNVTILPRPSQRPRPTFWIAATSTPDSFRRAGELGHNLMSIPLVSERMAYLLQVYRDSWKRAKHSGHGRVMLAFHMYCAESEEAAIVCAKDHFNCYMERMVDAAGDWIAGVKSKDYPDYEKLFSQLSEENFEKAREKGTAWIGTPEQLVNQARRYSELVGGFEEASLHTNFGTISRGDAIRSIELFATEVMPHLSEL
jgi:alkanesulfonate monooxygenase SsuD/methylene tetrahydromethanopterin reductase-like flavin-dependent oxidoreductase (luciferase family)